MKNELNEPGGDRDWEWDKHTSDEDDLQNTTLDTQQKNHFEEETAKMHANDGRSINYRKKGNKHAF